MAFQSKWSKHSYTYGYSKSDENLERRMRKDYIAPQAHKQRIKSTKQLIDSWQLGTNIWRCSGKHKGKQMRELPLSYLKWIGLNYDMNSIGFKLAVQELERRASNTKG